MYVDGGWIDAVLFAVYWVVIYPLLAVVTEWC